VPDLAHLADELAIRELLAAYCHRVDDGRFDDLVELFTPDGAFVRGTRTHSGRDALLAYFRPGKGGPSSAGRHLTLNPEIAIDGARGRVLADFLYLRVVDGKITPVIAGRYRDELVRGDDGRWRFARRVVEDWPPLA
jgi:SnoaL-like domain